MSGVLKFLFRAALVVGAILLVVGGALRIFFVTPVMVAHNGMAPTMLAGEQVLLWKNATPDLGDIAVCANASEVVLGRVVATEGMEVSTVHDQLTISGTRPDVDTRETIEFYNADNGRTEAMTLGIEKFGNTSHQVFHRERIPVRIRPITVPPGTLYLLGDNRNDAEHDSRSFGPVSATSCIGTVFMRWEPIDDRGANLEHGWLDILD